MHSVDLYSLDINKLHSFDKETVVQTNQPSSTFSKIFSILKHESEIERRVKELFQSRVGMQGLAVFNKVWSHAVKEAGVHFQDRYSVSIETLQKIDAALQRIVQYQGRGIDTSSTPADNKIVHSMMQYMIGSGALSLSWAERKTIQAVLLTKDHKLQKAMGEELRAALKMCAENPPKPGSKEEPLFEAFIGHVIALIPYCYPHMGDTFIVPVKQEGEWVSFEYHVDRVIKLTSEKFSTPIPFFGLVSEGAPPILTCMGTTYPAADGFIATVLADFTPGFSVGQSPYTEGQGQIRDWMRDKQDVQVYGMSLGGAFTLHLLREYKEKLRSVNAFNPAGLYPELWTEKYDEGVKINIYTQQGDIVSYLGAFPEGKNVNMYQFIRGQLGKSENPLSAHARVYAGADFVTMCKLDPSVQNTNRARKWLTSIHRSFSWLVYFSALVTYQALRIANAVRKALGLVTAAGLVKEKALKAGTLQDLESLDEEMQKHFGSSLSQKFSWTVLGEFYTICRKRKVMSDEEAKDPDWGRHHFMEASLELRHAAVARAVASLK